MNLAGIVISIRSGVVLKTPSPIIVTLSGIIILVSARFSAKALHPISVILGPIVMSCNDRDLASICFGITVNCGGKLNEIKLSLYLNAPSPISKTESGKFIVINPVLQNALTPMCVKREPSSKVIFLNTLDWLKVFSPIVVIFLGICILARVQFGGNVPTIVTTFGAIILQSSKVIVTFECQPIDAAAAASNWVPKNGS